MRALLIAVAAFLVLAAPASAQSTSLVVNEVDYDQASTDTAEFLEIKNVAAGVDEPRPVRGPVRQRCQQRAST